MGSGGAPGRAGVLLPRRGDYGHLKIAVMIVLYAMGTPEPTADHTAFAHGKVGPEGPNE